MCSGHDPISSSRRQLPNSLLEPHLSPLLLAFHSQTPLHKHWLYEVPLASLTYLEMWRHVWVRYWTTTAYVHARTHTHAARTTRADVHTQHTHTRMYTVPHTCSWAARLSHTCSWAARLSEPDSSDSIQSRHHWFNFVHTLNKLREKITLSASTNSTNTLHVARNSKRVNNNKLKLQLHADPRM